MKDELQFNILEIISRTGKKLKDSKLTRRALLAVENDTKKIAEYIGITEIQAALFSIVFIRNYERDNFTDIGGIAHYLGVSPINALAYYKELKEMAEKYILSMNNRHSTISLEGTNARFCVEQTLSESIINNEPYTPCTDRKERNVFEFLNYVGKNFFEKNEDDRVPNHIIQRKVLAKEKEFNGFPAIEDLRRILEINDRILFYDLCYDRTRSFSDGESSLIPTLYDLYTHDGKVKEVLGEFKVEKHPLQKLGLVKLIKNEIMRRPMVEVTDKGLETMLGEKAELYIDALPNKNIIEPAKIAAKTLFYSGETEEQISLLRSSLQNKKFRELQRRLAKEKMPKGICALFYGYPGTGKTESVYQLAKAAKRKIYHVDISQTKSCWFGESEKIIKEVFDKYRSLCSKCFDKKENIPILLFNEADSIFAKRKDSNASNVAQTENAIQNIILEEMENLEGILIATTNLQDNFDVAFERRFLFKIKFEKPTRENRAKIWRNKIASLSDIEALRLAENYDFSGGEIDNIARKSLMKNIISSQTMELKSIEQLCKTEKLHAENEHIIGFGA